MLRARGACTAAQVPIPQRPNSSGGEPSPPGSARMFIPSPPGSMRTVSPTGSARMFRPAGSDETIPIHNLDVENNGDWIMSYHFADALCIGQDEHRRVMVDLWNYTEVGTGRMVSTYFLCKLGRLGRTRCRAWFSLSGTRMLLILSNNIIV